MANSIQGVDPDPAAGRRLGAWLSLPLLVAAAVTVGLYVFGTQHVPDYSTSLFGATAADTLPLKSWLGTGLLALAGVQVALATWMYGRLPWAGVAPGSVVTGHRVVGACALLLTFPLAYHCAFAYGVQTNVDARVAVHSLAGCFFYGAFAAKVTIVRSRRCPGWTLPAVGAVLAGLVAVLWYTSALWYFNGYRLPIL